MSKRVVKEDPKSLGPPPLPSPFPTYHHESPVPCTSSESEVEPPRVRMMHPCSHFHYDMSELPEFEITVKKLFVVPSVGSNTSINRIDAKVTGNSKETVRFFNLEIRSSVAPVPWTVSRNLEQTRSFDQSLHQCVFHRQYSKLQCLDGLLWESEKHSPNVMVKLEEYFDRLARLPSEMISCGSVLNYLELDIKGYRLKSPITMDLQDFFNRPSRGTAVVIKSYEAKAVDELDLRVGQIVLLADTPSNEESFWWTGKLEFHIGYFPAECVETIKNQEGAIAIAKLMAAEVCKVGNAKVLEKTPDRFQLDLATLVENRKGQELTLKRKGVIKPRVFGCDLGVYLSSYDRELPLVLTECAQYVQDNLDEGVYRIAGSISKMERVREPLDKDQVPKWKKLEAKPCKLDVHSVCEVLKAYFREMNNPLLTYQLYSDFLLAATANKPLKAFRRLVRMIPPPKYETAYYLFRHLHWISEQSVTLQTADNLARVWAPNILTHADPHQAMQGIQRAIIAVRFMIINVELIFSNDVSLRQHDPRDPRWSKRAPGDCLSLLGSDNACAVVNAQTTLLPIEQAQEKHGSVSSDLSPGGSDHGTRRRIHSDESFCGGRSPDTACVETSRYLNLIPIEEAQMKHGSSSSGLSSVGCDQQTGSDVSLGPLRSRGFRFSLRKPSKRSRAARDKKSMSEIVSGGNAADTPGPPSPLPTSPRLVPLSEVSDLFPAIPEEASKKPKTNGSVNTKNPASLPQQFGCSSFLDYHSLYSEQSNQSSTSTVTTPDKPGDPINTSRFPLGLDGNSSLNVNSSSATDAQWTGGNSSLNVNSSASTDAQWTGGNSSLNANSNASTDAQWIGGNSSLNANSSASTDAQWTCGNSSLNVNSSASTEAQWKDSSSCISVCNQSETGNAENPSTSNNIRSPTPSVGITSRVSMVSTDGDVFGSCDDFDTSDFERYSRKSMRELTLRIFEQRRSNRWIDQRSVQTLQKRRSSTNAILETFKTSSRPEQSNSGSCENEFRRHTVSVSEGPCHLEVPIIESAED